MVSKKYKIEETKTLKRFKRLFRLFLEVNNPPYFDIGFHKHICPAIKDMVYSSKDVTDFSITLAEFQEVYNFYVNAGTFLSALVNQCKDEDITIVTEHLSTPVGYLGYKNNKNVLIKGNIGDTVGYEMERGTIRIEGNAIRGVGKDMRGGVIIIEGNAGEEVGRFMYGGEIYLNGGYRSIGDIRSGGTIYHKGEILVKDGKAMAGAIIMER
jgi:glutamate synthase domain-containing protein 3